MAEVETENPEKAAKKMTEAEADALKILSKTTEVAEAPMEKDTKEETLKTRYGALEGDILITYAVEEVPKEN